MKFETLGINGFGVFHDAELSELSPGVNVIEGPNEAGKSTALEFVRALLFGFEVGKNSSKYLPLHGGTHGGWATVRDREGRQLRIERNPGGAAGTQEVTLLGQTGTASRDALLGGADRVLFSNVFAFSLRELNDIDPLKVDKVRGRIYAAGSGTGGTSILTAIPAIEQKSLALFKHNAKANLPKLNLAMNELKDLRGQVSVLRERLSLYNQLSARQDDLKSRIQEMRVSELDAIAEEGQAIILQKAWPVWVGLTQTRAELADLPEQPPIPASGVARLGELLVERGHVEEQVTEARTQSVQLLQKIADFTLSQSLLDTEDDLRALQENLNRCNDARAQLPLLELQIQGLEAGVAATLRELGPHWTAENLSELETSLAQYQTIRQWRDRLVAAAMDTSRAKDKADLAREENQRLDAVYQAGLKNFERDFPSEPPAVPGFEARLTALSETDDLLEKRSTLGVELGRVQDRIKFLTTDIERLHQRTTQETTSRLTAAAEALAKAEVARQAAFPAAPTPIVDFAGQEEDLESCAALLGARKQLEFQGATLQAKIDELTAQFESAAKAHQNQTATLKAKAENQLAEARDQLSAAFPTAPAPPSNWPGAEADLTSAAQTLEKLQLAEIQLKNLEQHRHDLSGNPPGAAGLPSQWWAAAIVALAAGVGAVSLDRPIVAGVITLAGCLTAFGWWRAMTPRTPTGSTGSGQLTETEQARLTTQLAQLKAVLAELSARRGWTLTDLESVRRLERSFQNQKAEHARYEALRLEVTRAEKNREATAAELEVLRLAFVAAQETLRANTEAQRNALAQTNGQLEGNTARWTEIGRRRTWNLPDAVAIAQLKRGLRAGHEEWLRYQLLSGKVAESKLAHEAASKANAAQMAAAREQVRQWNEELEPLHQTRAQQEATAQKLTTQLAAVAAPSGWTLTERAAVARARESLLTQREKRATYDRALRELKELEADRATNQRELEQQGAAWQNAIEAENALNHDWSAWLATRHLPDSITTETCLSLLDTAKKAHESLQSSEQLRKTWEVHQKHIDQERKQVESVCAQLGLTPPQADEFAAWVRKTAALQTAERGKLIQRESLRERLRDLEIQIQNLDSKAKAIAVALEAQLHSAGAADEADFRNRAQVQEQRVGLSKAIQEQLSQLELLSAPGLARLRLEESLAQIDLEQISVRVETAKAERERIAAELEGLNNLAAESRVRLEDLENDESLTRKRREVEAKEAELVELAQRWAVLKLTHALLEKTRLKFERERQPGVVLRAGAILSTLTGGAYAGVIASEGLDSVELETPQGARKRMGEWSRGTAEQLYLALRFALIEDYSKVAEPLPLIMDDVLVHADGYNRLRLAARAIGEVARQHQVLYFTCRPGDADVLCTENPGARRYKLEGGKFGVVG